MSRQYSPTCYFQFVKRKLPALDDPSGVTVTLVLQQLWVSALPSYPDKWRDVPIVEDDT